MMAPGPLLCMLGFFIICALDALKVKGAILLGILAVTVISILLGTSQFGGIMAAAALDRADLPPARSLRRRSAPASSTSSSSSSSSRSSTPPAP